MKTRVLVQTVVITAYASKVLQDTNGWKNIIARNRNRFVKHFQHDNGSVEGTWSELASCPWCLAPYLTLPVLTGVSMLSRSGKGRAVVDYVTVVAGGALLRHVADIY